MHAEQFLDTNILLYAASRTSSEKEKRVTARELLSCDGVGLSVQVLAEFYVNATGKLRLPDEQVTGILEALNTYPILPVSESIFWTAIEIKKRYQISYWDGAIIAAAVELDCHTVYSEDLNHGQVYAGVRMINPFI